MLTILKNDKLQVLAAEECLRDYTFVWTESINSFFVEHNGWKNFAIIQSSVGIDGMMLSYLIIFALYGSTMRQALALILFYPVRNVIQAIFLMGRPVGFLWSWPGIMSLTVPYFDTNDFYFSGHVGSTTMFASEYIAMGWKKMAITISVIVADVWITLMFLRTHYIIDFTSGYVFARFVHRIGEKLSYYPDVKLLGYPREKRYAHNYDPCPKCGWGNEAVHLLSDPTEVEVQKKVWVSSLGDITVDSLAKNSDEEHLRNRAKTDELLQPAINSPNESNKQCIEFKEKSEQLPDAASL